MAVITYNGRFKAVISKCGICTGLRYGGRFSWAYRPLT